MNLGRTVFSQVIGFLPDREFRRCVARYDGDRRFRGFSCWDQFLAMDNVVGFVRKPFRLKVLVEQIALALAPRGQAVGMAYVDGEAER